MDRKGLKEIREFFANVKEIKDPIKRIDEVIKYIKTMPLNTIDIPIFILQEIRTLWDLHK